MIPRVCLSILLSVWSLGMPRETPVIISMLLRYGVDIRSELKTMFSKSVAMFVFGLRVSGLFFAARLLSWAMFWETYRCVCGIESLTRSGIAAFSLATFVLARAFKISSLAFMCCLV